MRRALSGTWSLVRLILRRDRLSLLIWIAVAGLVPVSVAAVFRTLYRTPEALSVAAVGSNGTRAAVGLLGFVYAPSVGGLVAWRTGMNSAFLIAPVAILLVIRHTRTEEETGRRELLGSAVGRQAPLAAALVVVVCSTLAMAALIAGGLVGQGLPAAGAVALGVSAASAGCTFAAVAAVVAQVTASPGAAQGISLGLFALTWFARSEGDLHGLPWLSWASPLGWIRLTRPFAGERWWVFGLVLGLFSALVTVACALSARRDIGAALLPQRLGPGAATPALRSPLALAWRLHRGALLGWAAGAAVLGLLLGALGQSLSRFVDQPLMQEWAARAGARDAGDAFLFLIMYVLGQVVSAYAIAAVLRARAEEVEGRADIVLAGPVGRLRWAGGHLFFAAIGSALVLAVLGVTIGVGYGVSAGDLGRELPRLVARTMLALPACWVMAGLTAALYGVLPRLAAGATWGAFGVFLALELGWELGQVSRPVFAISPFAHVYWASPVSATALLVLATIAGALVAVGQWGLLSRDFG